MATYTPKASEIQREWHVVDAEGMVLGRLCTEVARILRGKHKPTFAPHIDTGDHVIIVNADKIVMTSNKAERTMVYRHSGYPGGIKSESYAHLHARKPAEAVRKSIRGMLPKGPLGRQQITKLQIYKGPNHPHPPRRPRPSSWRRQGPLKARWRRITCQPTAHPDHRPPQGSRRPCATPSRHRPVPHQRQDARGLLPDGGVADGRLRGAHPHRNP